MHSHGHSVAVRDRRICGCSQGTFCIIVVIIVVLILAALGVALGLLLPRKDRNCDCVHGTCGGSSYGGDNSYGNNYGSSHGGTYCACYTGYTGSKCDIRSSSSSCDASYCVHGSCSTNSYGSQMCSCTGGYTGSRCDIPSSSCDAGYCVYGICSMNSYGTPICSCTGGYTGSRCDIPPGSGSTCNSVNCVWGTCSASGQCICEPGYTGTWCNAVVGSPCSPNPCLYGGLCAPSGASHTCNCASGWTGLNCQTSSCGSHQCAQGSCVADSQAGYTCNCYPNYSGTYCDVYDNPCIPDPCTVGQGTCQVAGSNFGDGYSCLCDLGFSGPTCQVDVCTANMCVNGNCMPTSAIAYWCDCDPGWEGNACADEKLCTYPVGSLAGAGTAAFNHFLNGYLEDLTVTEYTSGTTDMSFKGIQVDYSTTNSAWEGYRQTGGTWADTNLNLVANEYITEVSGIIGEDATDDSSDVLITQITFKTSDGRTFGPYGGSPTGTATPFVHSGLRLKYISGSQTANGIEQMSFVFICA